MKKHTESCNSNKFKHYGDRRNAPDWNEKQECNCDGYHTFDELYDHRITLFIELCKQINRQPYNNNSKYGIWRSELHSDGSNFEGWFILGIGKEKGKQITYHLTKERWQDTWFAETLNKAPEWDGHTPVDVLERLRNL